MKHKPFRIIRQIDVFDVITEKLVDEFPLNSFDLDEIKTLITANENDPLLYDGYSIEGKLQQYFEAQGFVFDRVKHVYYLACYQDNS